MKKRIAVIGLGFLANLLVGTHLFSNPTGANVIAGDICMENADTHHLKVESRSDRAIIDWESFSIDQNEATYFQLPSATSAVLNRVTSNFPSILSGHLISNGSVYLINSNGVIVSEEGVVDTASFLASTLDVNSDAFLLSSDLLFAGASQEAIINKGKITAWNGDVLFLGVHVRNENVIEAKEGIAALGAGSEILVSVNGEQRLSIALPAQTLVNGMGVEQHGIIDAMQAELKAVGNAYALAVHNSGYIHAAAAEERSGRVYLIAEGGAVSHTGKILAFGGDVQILGETVALTENAIVDVSSDCGGGSILVGGDYKNQNPNILTAEHTFIEDGVTLNADALVSGSGGKIIVWGLQNSLFFGNATARGRGLNGAGGFVEVSSIKGLFYKGMTNTLAQNGKNGMLLLDPTDFTISAAATTAGLTFGPPASFANTYSGAFDGVGGPFMTVNILTSDLLTQLAATNVTVDASQGTGTGGGSITINLGDVAFDTTGLANDLTLIAFTDVDINENIIHGGTGDFNIYAGAFNDNGTNPPIAGTSTGTITTAVGIDITISNTGSFLLNAYGPSMMDGIVIQGALDYTGSGGLTIETEQGNVHFSGAMATLTSSGAASGVVLIDSAEDILFDATAPIVFSAGAAGLTMTAITPNTITLGDFSFDSTGAATIQGGAITVSGATTVGATVTSPVSFTSTSGDITLTGNVTSSPAVGGGLTISSANDIFTSGDITINDPSSFSFLATGDGNLQGTNVMNLNSSVAAVFQGTTVVGDGTNVFTLNGIGSGGATFASADIQDMSLFHWQMGSGSVSFSGTLTTDSGSTMTFDAMAGGLTLAEADLGGAFNYLTTSTLTATSSSPFTVQTTGVVTLNGGMVNIALTGTGSINLNNTGVSSFAILGSTDLTMSTVDGNISMGPAARIDYSADNSQTIETTGSGDIIFNGSSLINFLPSAMANLTIQATGTGDVTVSTLIYGPANTGLATIASATGSVTVANGATLTFLAAAGGLDINAATGFFNEGAINYASSAADLDIAVSAGNAEISATGSISMDGTPNLNIGTIGTPIGGNITSLGTITLAATATGTLGMFANGNITPGNITSNSTGDITISALMGGDIITNLGTTIALGAMAGIADLNITGDAITLNGDITSAVGSTGAVTVTGANNFTTSGDFTFNGSGDVTFETTGGSIVFQSTTTTSLTAGNFFVNANGIGFNIVNSGTLNFSSGMGKTFAWSADNGITIGNINNTASGGPNTLTTTNADINLNQGDSINFSGTAGDLTLTSTTGNINLNGNVTFSSGVLTGSGENIGINQNVLSFTGTSRFDFTATTGSLSINPTSLTQNSTAIANSLLTATISGISINGTLNFSGGVSGLTATANTDLNINASFDYAASNPAILQSTTGGVFSGGAIHLLAGSGDLSLLALMGAIATGNTMTFDAMAGGLTIHSLNFISAGALITYNSSDPLSIISDTSEVIINNAITENSSGLTIIDAGNDVLITNPITNAGTGNIDITAAGTLRLEPALGTQGSIAWQNQIDVSATEMIRMFGEVMTASMTSVNGPINITTSDDVFLLGNALIDSGLGAFNLTIGGSLNLLAAANTIITGSSGVVAITDNLFILADSGGLSEITAAGAVSVSSTSGGIYLVGYSAVNTSSINSTGGGIVTVETIAPGQGNIVVRDFSNITTTANILLFSQGNVIIENSSSIDNSGGAGSITIGSLVNPVLGDIVIAGGLDGLAQVLSGTGGISMQVVNDVQTYGLSSANNVQIIADDGSLTIQSSTRSLYFNNFTEITLSSGMGALDLTGSQDVLIGGASTVTNSGTGTSTFTAQNGEFNVLATGIGAVAGASDTTITCGTGLTSINAGAKFNMISGLFGSATVICSGSIDLSVGDNTNLIGNRTSAPAGNYSSVVSTSTTGSIVYTGSGDVNLLEYARIGLTNAAATGDVTIQGGVMNVRSLNVMNGSSLFNSGSGDVSTIGALNNEIHISGGTGIAGDSFVFSTSGNVDLSCIGNITIDGGSEGSANVTAAGNVTLASTVNSISLLGNITNSHPALVSSTAGGLVTLSAPRSIALFDNGNVTTSGSISFVSAGIVTIENTSTVSSTGGGTVTMGVMATPIGALYVIGGANGASTISTATGAVSIFTTNNVNLHGAGAMSQGIITVAGGAGSLGVTAGTEIFVGSHSTITQAGTGTLTLTTTSDNITLVGGPGNATVQGGTGTVTVQSGDKLNIIAGAVGLAQIVTTGDLLISATDEITFSGNSAAAATANTSTGLLSVTGAQNLNLLDNANITITGVANANALTLSITNDLVIVDLASVEHQGTGAVSVTSGGNADVFAGELGDGFISSNSTLTVSVTGVLDIQAASGFEGYLLSNGLTSVTAGELNLFGDDVMVRASIENASGNLTVTSGLTTINNHAHIELTAGAGNMVLMFSDDLIIADDSFIQNSSTGTLDVTTSAGSITLLGGVGNALITGSTNTTTVTAAGNVFVLSDPTGFAEITSTGDLSVDAAGGGVYVIGSPDGAQISSINSLSGAVDVSALSDIIAENSANITTGVMSTLDITLTATNGSLILNNDAFVDNLGTGDVVGTIGENVLILAGPAGASFIQSNALVALTIGSDLDIQALSGNAAYISSNSGGMTETIAANRITLIGQTALASATIFNLSGAMTITGTYVDLNDNAQISILGGAGTLTVSASDDVRIANASSIRHLGTGLLNATATDTLYIEGGPLGNAMIAGGTGGVIVSANSAFLDGYGIGMTTTTASITALSGALSVTTTFGTLSLNQHASILLSGGAGAMAVTVANNLLVAHDASIRNNGSGTTTVAVTGLATLLAGTADARVQGNTGIFSLTATEDIRLLSSTNGQAAITSSGQMSIVGSSDILLEGSPQGAKQSLIQTSTNTLTVTASQNVNLLNNARIASTGGAGTLTINATNGTLTIQNQSSIQHTGTGALSFTIGANALISAGPNGNAFIQSPVGLTLGVNGALTIQAQSNAMAMSSFTGFIQSAGNSTITAGKISMTGVSSTFQAFIRNTSGTLAVSTTNGSIDMQDQSLIQLAATGTTLTVNTVGGDLRIANGSSIQNLGTMATNSSVASTLTIEGGPLGQASFTGTTGTMTVSANAIQMNGFSSAFNALLSTTQGALSISSTSGAINLSQNATMSISSVVASSVLQVTAANDLLVTNNSIIRNFGTGALNVAVTAGALNVIAGAGNATIQSGSGGLSLNAMLDNINILSDRVGTASVISTGNVSVTSGQNISVVGSPGGGNASVIRTGAASNPTMAITATGGILSILNNANIEITTGSGTLTVNCADLWLENDAQLQQLGTGAIASMLSGDLTIMAGPAGASSLLTNTGLTLNVGGDLKITADANGIAQISTKGTTSITAGRVHMIGFSASSASFAALITNTTGSLSVSATTIDLIDFAEILLTGGEGTLSLTTTTSDLRIANGSFVQNSGSGSTTANVNDTFFLEGGQAGSARFLGGTGGMTVQANALMLTGFSSGNRAMITTTSGGLSVVANSTVNLTPFATLSQTSAMGASTMDVTAGTDLLISNGSIISNLATGLLTVTVGRSAELLGGLDNAILQAGGALTLSAVDNIHVIANREGFSQITAAGNVSITSASMMPVGGGSIYVLGAPQALLNGSIQSTGGSVSLSAYRNIVVQDFGVVAVTAGAGTIGLTTTTGDLVVQNGSSISGLAGTLTGSINKSALVKAGSAGNAFISNTGVMNVTVGADLNVEAPTGAQAFISCNGNMSSITAGRIYMEGSTPMQQAYLQNSTGSFTISAQSIHMLDFARISLTAGAGTLSVSSISGELRLANGSLIQNSGSGLTTVSASSTLYVEGGSSISAQTAIKGGTGGLNVSAAQILMNGFSAANNALIQAANGTMNITTTGMLNMTPNSRINLVAGVGMLNVTVGGNFYRTTATSTITAPTMPQINLMVAGTSCTSCM